MKDDIFCFEQLGVDYMFVDEAHMFKNCMITTKLSNVAGLSTTSSNKSMDMLWKCKYLSEIQNGRVLCLQQVHLFQTVLRKCM